MKDVFANKLLRNNDVPLFPSQLGRTHLFGSSYKNLCKYLLKIHKNFSEMIKFSVHYTSYVYFTLGRRNWLKGQETVFMAHSVEAQYEGSVFSSAIRLNIGCVVSC